MSWTNQMQKAYDKLRLADDVPPALAYWAVKGVNLECGGETQLIQLMCTSESDWKASLNERFLV